MTEDPAPYEVTKQKRQTPLARVFEAAECRTQVELATFLGIRQSSISDAKRRGSVPADWLIVLLEKKGINPRWIETGNCPRHMQPCDENAALFYKPVVIIKFRPLQECSMEELMQEMIRRANASFFSEPAQD